MSYDGIDKFLVRAMLKEIERLDSDPSGEGYARIADNVTSYVRQKRISPNQATLIFEAMGDEEVPDFEPETDSRGRTLQDVGNALTNLSLAVSQMRAEMGPEQTAEGLTLQDVSDAVADPKPSAVFKG